MQALATFIMRGRSQAVLVTAVAALLSMLVPLAGLISSAAVALVTLRQGAGEGLWIGIFAGLASGLLAFAALGSPAPAIGFALALWLPVWLMAVALRHGRSLSLTVQAAALIGLAILVGLHLKTAEPSVYWAELLEPVRASLVSGALLDEAGSRALVEQLARWMTGIFAASFYFQALLALFIGRWWQAALYNPGGFGGEFRALRLHPGVGFLGAASFIGFYLAGEAGWAADLVLLLGPLFLLQGIALVHALAAGSQLRRGWLIGFYVLLVLAMPHAELLVAGLGFADIWTDIRSKLGGRGGKAE